MELYRGGSDQTSAAHYMEAHNEYSKILIREDTYWRQRAKMHWLRNGDLNTKFFHRSASARCSFQKIKMLHDEENVEVSDQEGLCGVAKRYFDSLFAIRTG